HRLNPARSGRPTSRHAPLPARPPFEFGHRACGDHRNPLVLETLDEPLPPPIVVVDEYDRQPRIGEQVSAAGASPLEHEGAIADAGHLQRRTLRTTVFHVTTSSIP